jgi:hypothetical protein
MARLRAVFTAARHLVVILLCTIALHLYTYILTAVMKKLNAARCAVTDELLRRRDQLDSDNVIHSHAGNAKVDSLQSGLLKTLRLDERRGGPRLGLNLPCIEPTAPEASTDQTATCTTAHSSIMTMSGRDAFPSTFTKLICDVATHPYRRYLDMWAPAPRESRMTGTILTTLRKQAERTEQQRDTAQSTSQLQSASVDSVQTLDHHQDYGEISRKEAPQTLTQASTQQETEITLTAKPLRHRTENDDNDIMASPSPSNAEQWQYPSPCSETTLADDPNAYCSILLDANEVLTVDDCSEGRSSISTLFSLDERIPESAVTTGHTRARRPPFYELTSGYMGTPSRILGDRERTNEGLLELRANASKGNVTPVRGHRRKVSLNLPVRHRGVNSHIFQFPSPKSRWATHPFQTPNQTPAAVTFAQEERELEYKHRHTFVGTASLDVFLEILEMSASHTVTTSAVVKAFTTLASNEQMLARQSSSRKDGWDVVSRITLDIQAPDYIAQTHIKLGSITLRQFLDLIPFDANERADAMAVLGAFCAASHLDTKAGMGTASKARAFRSWMVRQAEADM